MTVEEAYEVNRLKPALQFEAEQLLRQTTGQPVRQVGTTTRMCMMAALDIVDGLKVVLRAYDRAEVSRIHLRVQKYAEACGADDERLDRIDTYLTSTPLIKARGSLARVYTDHLRDALDEEDLRVPGPLGWAFSARQANIIRPPQSTTGITGVFSIHDRDGILLGHVTKQGLVTLQRKHFVEVVV